MKSPRLFNSRMLALLAVGAMPTVALAQGGAGKKVVADVKAMADNAAEAPLPDVDAVEKGQNPPASVSFRPLDRRKMGESGADAGNGAQGRSAQASGTDAAEGLNRPTQVSRIVPSAQGDDSSLEEFTEGQPAAPVQVPELHTVAAGDTLWTLCKTFYNDPWSWPQLWSLNPLVTNPHWIFPGDVLRLKAAEGDGNTAVAQQEDPIAAERPGLSRSNSNASSSETSIVVGQIGFLDTGDLKHSAKVTGSREEKIMLSQGDQAYLSFPKERPLVAGERYSVFQVETDRPVLDPTTQKPVGYIVKVYGDILVEQIADEKTGRGTLGQVTDPVERGFFISDRVKPFKRVDVRPSNVNLQANVIASFTPTNLLSAANFVVISRGAQDGIEVGNRTYVIRRGDGYARLMEGWEESDSTYPKEVVAELVVIDVKEKMSVAWITRSTKEIRVGEVTEMRKGY